MRINNNMSAVITNNKLLGTEGSLSDVMEKLSSGFNINHASDNPSGIAIAAKMQAQIDGLDQASTNGSDGISVLQTAEGALNEVTGMIQRMRELAVQAANGTNSDDEKEAIQKEINSLLEEIDRVADTTEFNSINLLNGSLDTRIYADHCTRMQSSNKVPAGIYQLDIVKAATQGTASTTASTGGNITETVTNDYLNETTVTAITVPDNSNFKDYIDGTNWTVTKNGTQTASGSGLGISGTITINGYGIQLMQGASGESVYGQLRDACEKAGVIISNPNELLEIRSEKFGAKANLKVELSSVEFAKALGFSESDFTAGENGPVIEKVGTDAKVNLYKDDQDTVPSLFGKQATVNYDGNHITVKDTKGFELSFYAEAGFDQQSDTATTNKGRITFNVTDIGSMSLQVGANKGQSIDVRIAAVTTEFMYIDKVNVTKMDGPEDAMDALGTALNYVTAVRSQLGAYENRLDHTTKSLDATEENMTSAISRIEDTDMATTMVEYTKLNVLEQAGVSALAQANELPQLALQLLQ